MTGIRSKALIGLGSNLSSSAGNSTQTLGHALYSLCKGDMTFVAVSRFFRTPFFPSGTGPDFVNAVVLIETMRSPTEILANLHRIEQQFGRMRLQRWGTRTLDLDLLAIGQSVLPDVATLRRWMDLPPELQMQDAPDQLILPHPRLQDRAFVLVPMADIAPDWLHPVLRKTVTEMCRDLPADDVAAVRPL